MAISDTTDKVEGNGVVTVPTDQHPGDAHEIPGFEPHTSWDLLKDRIKLHYNLASDYYYSLWGEHIHHSYFKSPKDTKETGQVNLIELLLELGIVQSGSKVLDVGCGIGGTSRYLAKHRDCEVLGITISTRQVELAKKLSLSEKLANPANESETFPLQLAAAVEGAHGGTVNFEELDAERMQSRFQQDSFDVVWISEALSHFPDKPLFFRNAHAVLRKGGCLVLADWFKASGLSDMQMTADIQPIEDGMLLPPLCTIHDYVKMAQDAGLKIRRSEATDEGFIDISKEVAKTWDISWSLIQSPSLWAFAISQGRDGLAFLQAFRAMRRGYANGTFRYAVMAFEKA